MRNLHIGTMGWSYDFWLGNFYPPETKPINYLVEYSKEFSTVEVDSTFYRIPSPDFVEGWRNRTPDDFVFTAKFPKRITHEKMLKDYDDDVEIFIKNISLLGDKLGPLLLQFPYQFKPEERNLLENFLKTLPDKHRYAVEIKNRKWLEEDFYNMLRDQGIALALIDHPWMPEMDTLTADFTYIRWEGDRKKVKGTTGKVEGDRKEDLRKWSEKIKRFLEDGIEVYGYFSKYYSGHSPTDVRRLLEYI